jgi:hypothetical protein
MGIVPPRDEFLVNDPPNSQRFLWVLLPSAIVLVLAAWLRGAEYDEQYTLFLTAGISRPDWPSTVFPAGLAPRLQSGTASFVAIAHDLRSGDVHPPLYFWLLSIWRAVFGYDLFVARLFSVVLALGALALTGMIARAARVSPVWAMLLTLGCYGFAYTSVIARGFALAELLVLGGVACLLVSRGPWVSRGAWRFAAAGILFGAATLTNYLAVFSVGGCLLAICLRAVWPGTGRSATTSLAIRSAVVAIMGFLVFIPADLWWFLAQRNSREGQFPPFSLLQSLLRLASRGAGDILGGLPLYVDGIASTVLAAAMGLLLVGLVACVVWRWRHIGERHARIMFAIAALSPPIGLLALGAIFNNTPIEVRYLSFSTPFVGLLLAGAPGVRTKIGLLAVQAASIVGLMLAPQTMQPTRAAAHAASELARDGIVLLPRGNDGVGVVGGFAIEASPALPLLLIPGDDTPARILSRIGTTRRVVLALMEQDDASLQASQTMRQAMATPDWREVARGSHIAVYERVGHAERQDGP